MTQQPAITPAITLVVAIAQNGAIGVKGDLPWRLPGDLAFFRKVTMGKPILMGRRTWDSLPRSPLPGRPNLVITRNSTYRAEGAEIFHSFRSALDRAMILAMERGNPEICIIGGAELYRQALPHANRLYMTEVHMRPQADTFFPSFDRQEWEEQWREAGPPSRTGSMTSPAYDFILLQKRTALPFKHNI